MTAAWTPPVASGDAVVTQRWRAHLIALGGVAAAILLLFRADVASMVGIWWNASTFGHCLFIPPLIAWLVGQRLPELQRMQPAAWWPGLVWLGLGALGWVMGYAAGVALFRHAGLVAMLQGATIALIGAQASRVLMFPIFYAVFMVPFGEEVVPYLQLLTARMAVPLLDLAGIAAHLDGIFITTPTGYFEVAEACSGAKFLIAMSAYGALVCYLCFKEWGRRIAFLAGALTVSLLANAVRAAVTIWVADTRTVDAAVGFDHVVYGWVFFAVVITIVMAAAWPFFDRSPVDGWPEVKPGTPSLAGSLRATAGAAFAIVAAGPLWFAIASSGSAAPVPVRLGDVRGWQADRSAMTYPWMPRFVGADQIAHRRYRNGAGDVVDLFVARFDRQEEGKELVGFGQGAVNPDSEWVWSAPAPAPADGLGERITAPGPVVREVVTFYALGGVVTGNAGTVKWETLKARLLGGDQRAVAIIVSAEERNRHPAARSIATFLRDAGPVEDLADAGTPLR